MNDIQKKAVFLYSVLLLCFVILSGTVHAQSNKGSIIGTTKDPNDAVVPNAKVTIANNATGETRETTSSEDGDFSFANLEPGNYKITVEATGLRTLVLSSVTVETNSRVPVDAKFTEVSGVDNSVVTITDDSAPLVESETSVRGDVITGREVTDLPLGQRNFTVLAGLSPGVTRPTGSSFGLLGGGNEARQPNFPSAETARFRESGGSAISANGARVTQNEFLLDGVDNNEAQFRQIAIFPNPDGIAEFKIETSVPRAELGRAGGAIISTTLKSGGNDFHGSAFEFYQGRFLSAAAADFDKFNNPVNRPGGQRSVPNYISHNFGGTIGGPVYLPRFGDGVPALYDGRNRTFFFFSYGGQRGFVPAVETDSIVNTIPVPTARQRLGDFSELLRPGTAQRYRLANGTIVTAPVGTIFDPNGVPIPGNDLRNCTTCGAFSNFGRNFVNAFPFPTINRIGENYTVNRLVRPVQDGYDVRLDHQLFEGNNLFFRFSNLDQERTVDNFFPLGSSPTGNDLPAGPSAGTIVGNSRAAVLGDTQTFGTNIVNDFRFGYTRVQIGILNTGVFGTGGFNPNVSAALGARNINTDPNSSGIVLLGIVDQIGGGDRAVEFTGDGGPFLFKSNNFNLSDSVTVVKGNSIFKFGFDGRLRQNTNIDGGRNGGIKGNVQYGTSSRLTSLTEPPDNSGFANFAYNGIGPNDTGSALANFLLGYTPGVVSRGTPGTDALLETKEVAFFVQDDWKATQNLTLNLGLRYDLFTAPTERFDRISNYNIQTGNLDFAGDNNRDLAKNDLNNFGPRIGFAYSIGENKSVVLRGGYGIVYSVDASGIPSLNTNPGNGGGNYNCNPITNPAGCPAGVIGRNLYDRGLPSVNSFFAPRGSSSLSPTGGTIIYNDPNRKDARFQQYNLTLQYGFWNNWLAEAAYVGSTGNNLLIVQNIGNGNDRGAPGSREVTNIGNVIASRYNGDFSYNAFQSKIERRFTDGFSLISSYTFAKAIDNTPGGFCLSGGGQRNCGPDNPLRLELDRALSDTDIRHRVTFASVYDIPIGKKRRFLSDLPTALDYVIGGWQINNIVTLQSGPVYDVTANGGRVDIIGDPTPTAQQRAQGIQLNRAAFRESTTLVFAADRTNTNCFTDGRLNGNCPVFGNLGRNTFRGDFQEYWDAGLFKNLPIGFINEQAALQLRISVFNVLNHVNRGRPNGDFNSDSFGKDNTEQRRRQLEFGLRLVF
jgi:Carboxypeptidase regulatory-like domain/TonB dependent receptor